MRVHHLSSAQVRSALAPLVSVLLVASRLLLSLVARHPRARPCALLGPPRPAIGASAARRAHGSRAGRDPARGRGPLARDHGLRRRRRRRRGPLAARGPARGLVLCSGILEAPRLAAPEQLHRLRQRLDRAAEVGVKRGVRRGGLIGRGPRASRLVCSAKFWCRCRLLGVAQTPAHPVQLGACRSHHKHGRMPSHLAPHRLYSPPGPSRPPRARPRLTRPARRRP